MQLYAAGFNAWGQLQFKQPDGPGAAEPEDIAVFTLVLEDATISHVRPSLTFTEVTTSQGVRTAGAAPAKTTVPGTRGSFIYCEALNGCSIVYDTAAGIIRQSAPSHHTRARDQGQGDGADTFSFPLPCVVQIVAYHVGFAALTESGQVWTWGDGRFPECLGRDTEDRPSSADRPRIVTALEDLPSGPIVKIAAGGYVLAALTRGQDMYCWGGYPGQQQRNPVLKGITGEPEPVVVALKEGEVEVEADIVDVGVGDGHMIVLTSDGSVCVVGSNANGQLGLGTTEDAGSTWAKVEGIPAAKGQRVTGVFAGPRSSMIVVVDECE